MTDQKSIAIGSGKEKSLLPDPPGISDNHVWNILKNSMDEILQTYANVHRGSSHFSRITTHLFEEARKIILSYLNLSANRYNLVFCTPRRASVLCAVLNEKDYHTISDKAVGLPLGVTALAIKKGRMPSSLPFQQGGGTLRLIGPDWMISAKSPARLEAGTPPIVNFITFARALQLIRKYGKEAIKPPRNGHKTAQEILYHDSLIQYKGGELMEHLRENLIGRTLTVPTRKGASPYVNLDNAASSPTFLPVWNSMLETWCQTEPVQHQITEAVRSICSTMLGAPPESYDILFTSNTTEAINLVAESMSKDITREGEAIILNTLLEHNSNEVPWRNIPGHSTLRMAVDDEGFIDLAGLRSLLQAYNREKIYGSKRIRLVAISGASNVLGSYNDLAEIGNIVHEYGAQVFVDAAQLIAHRPVDMVKWNIDYLAFSGHKVYAPFGSGALVCRKWTLNFSEAELEQIRASGEANTGGIAAMGKALLLLGRIGFDTIREQEAILTKRVLEGVANFQDLKVLGIQNNEAKRFAQKGGVIAFAHKRIMSDRLARRLALESGIGVRHGCLCTHMLIKHLLHVGPGLERFQSVIVRLIPKIELPGVVRVSFGIHNVTEDVDAFMNALEHILINPVSDRTGLAGSAGSLKPPRSQKEINDEITQFILQKTSRVFQA